MARSLRYIALERELHQLRQHLLPRRFSSTGVYRTPVHTRTLAYRVLAHAELESYLEDRVKAIYRKAITSYRNNGTVTRVLASMLAFSGVLLETPPESIVPPQPNQAPKWDDKIKLANKITLVGNAFNSTIEKNHGIKEKNLLSLLLTIGVDPDEIDGAWLSNMDSFGKERGVVAHSSQSVHRTQQPPDPESEHRKVLLLLNGTRVIDEVLNRLENI